MFYTDVTEALVNDGLFATDPEYMPGDYAILYRDIRAYRNGEDFIIRDVSGRKSKSIKIEFSPEIMQAFIYYYKIWENWYSFNQLPNAGTNGTLNELPWVLDFLKTFDRVSEEIKTYKQKKK